MTSNDMCEYTVEVKHRTDMAILVPNGIEINGIEEKVWLPLSRTVIEEEYWEIGDIITIGIPEWLAQEKGFE